MLFSEVYSAYFTVVSEILTLAGKGEMTDEKMKALIRSRAFGESDMAIRTALKSGKWSLLRPDLTSVLQTTPERPLTDLERRWLKAISLDPRVKLFDFDFSGLEDVHPLFVPEDICYFDRYEDGDDFEDEGYIRRFRKILRACETSQPLELVISTRKAKRVLIHVIPEYLEYSEKDDKFRLITSGNKFASVINLGKIFRCTYHFGNDVRRTVTHEARTETLVFLLEDRRSALERALYHFAHFEKQVEKLGSAIYRVTLRYDKEDESELVIRLLSFGPMVQVIEPQSMVDGVKKKLLAQKRLGSV